MGSLLLAVLFSSTSIFAQTRPRARELGIHPGTYDPGTLDAITDVDGVRVGQITINEVAMRFAPA
jgi:D-aminopeptidase